MFNIRAVIFDFDGTLANTLPICFYAFQHVFKEFDNKDLSSEEIKAMFGPSETGIIRDNLSHINKEHANCIMRNTQNVMNNWLCIIKKLMI